MPDMDMCRPSRVLVYILEPAREAMNHAPADTPTVHRIEGIVKCIANMNDNGHIQPLSRV